MYLCGAKKDLEQNLFKTIKVTKVQDKFYVIMFNNCNKF